MDPGLNLVFLEPDVSQEWTARQCRTLSDHDSPRHANQRGTPRDRDGRPGVEAQPGDIEIAPAMQIEITLRMESFVSTCEESASR